MTWRITAQELPSVGQPIAVRGRTIQFAEATFDGEVFIVNGVKLLPEDIDEWLPLGDE
jgi:hypothetical protein